MAEEMAEEAKERRKLEQEMERDERDSCCEECDPCDLLDAFISAEDGFIGGTRFEVEYAVGLGIPVQIHRENGPSQWIFQYSFPFLDERKDFFLAWEGFFHKIRFELGGSS